MISLDDVQRARVEIAPYVRRTTLEKNTTLSSLLRTNIYLKLELFQRTGSFKPRGAFNQILQLSPEQRRHGVVGVSGGNFAQGMALAARELNTRAIVCMPTSTPKNYIEATQGYGAQVDLSPDFPQVFARADQLKGEGWNLLHPFDNPFQMAGAGTIGLEMLEDLPHLTDVFISIGGGGLITGIAVAIASAEAGGSYLGCRNGRVGYHGTGHACRQGRANRPEVACENAWLALRRRRCSRL